MNLSVFLLVLSLLISFLCFLILMRNAKKLHLSLFLVLIFISQNIFVCLRFWWDSNWSVYNIKYIIPVDSFILNYSYSLSLCCFAILLCTLPFLKYIKITNNYLKFNILSCLPACIIDFLVFFYSIVVLVRVFIQNYLIILLDNYLMFFPFVVGFVFLKLNRLYRLFFFVSISIVFVYNTLLGSRGMALFPLLFFILGFLLFLKRSGHTILIKVLLVLLLVFVPSYMVIVENYRSIYGRGIIDKTSLNNLTSVSSNSDSSNVDMIERFINNPMLAVFYLSDKLIPYRNTEGLGDELLHIVSVSGEANRNSTRLDMENATYGIGVANRYGFYCGLTSSVEFNIYSDLYSRGGLLILFIGVSACTIFLCFLEVFFLKEILKYNNIRSFILLYFYLYVTFKCFWGLYQVPFLSFFRSLVLNFLLFVLVPYLALIPFKKNKYL